METTIAAPRSALMRNMEVGGVAEEEAMAIQNDKPENEGPSPQSFDQKLDIALREAERLSRDLNRLAVDEANARLAAMVLKQK